MVHFLASSLLVTVLKKYRVTVPRYFFTPYCPRLHVADRGPFQQASWIPSTGHHGPLGVHGPPVEKHCSGAQIKKSETLSLFYSDKSKFELETYTNDPHNELYSFFTNPRPLNNQNFNEIFKKFTKTVSSFINKHALLEKFSRRLRK